MRISLGIANRSERDFEELPIRVDSFAVLSLLLSCTSSSKSSTTFAYILYLFCILTLSLSLSLTLLVEIYVVLNVINNIINVKCCYNVRFRGLLKGINPCFAPALFIEIYRICNTSSILHIVGIYVFLCIYIVVTVCLTTVVLTSATEERERLTFKNIP